MAQTTVLEETTDSFSTETGEVTEQTRRTIKKSRIAPTDEFIKVSKYLNTIFAYNNIPLNLVPISLLIAQEMEFKTNIVYLNKYNKEKLAEMLDGMSLTRVNALIQDLKKYDIIRPLSKGRSAMYEVNSFLFSTGSIVETRELQAHFDFDNERFASSAVQTNTLTGETVRKAVQNKKDKFLIDGQMKLALTQEGE